MRPKVIELSSLAAADPNGVCVAQTPTGAGNLTITGALASGGVATFDYPRHVSITSDGNDSGVTITVTGTDRNNDALTEAITGPDTATVKGTKNFKTVTQVAISAAGTGSITVGSADELETGPYPVNTYSGATAYDVQVTDGTGGSVSLTWTSQYTLDNPFAADFTEDGAKWYNELLNKTSDQANRSAGPITALRFKVVNIEANDAMKFNIVQQDRA